MWAKRGWIRADGDHDQRRSFATASATLSRPRHSSSPMSAERMFLTCGGSQPSLGRAASRRQPASFSFAPWVPSATWKSLPDPALARKGTGYCRLAVFAVSRTAQPAESLARHAVERRASPRTSADHRDDAAVVRVVRIVWVVVEPRALASDRLITATDRRGLGASWKRVPSAGPECLPASPGVRGKGVS